MSAPYTSTKTYRNLPCSHRQWRHEGHCAFIHGYSRSFTFTFGCTALSDTHFVVDFGGLRAVRAWLEEQFDHTLLVCADDPELALFRQLHERGLCDLRVLPNVSMEGSARFVFEHVDNMVREQTGDRAWLVSVECRENDKNAATYCPGAS